MPAIEQYDQAVRAAAFRWLDERGAETRALHRDELVQFTFHGENIRLWDQRGIRVPSQLGRALIISSQMRGGPDEYEDPIVGGLQRYAYEKGGPEAPGQRALREVMNNERPLIWLVQVANGLWQAVYPVYIIGEEADQERFVLAVDAAQRTLRPDLILPEIQVEYQTRLTHERVHQRVFASQVMLAYGGSCAVCDLRHRPLLDAAHIKEDSQGGPAVVTNGLALCKIHHGAFDSQILGITPSKEPRVEIRGDVLREVDGPMLQHGLQMVHGELLRLPKSSLMHPNRDYLAERYEAFRGA